MGKIKLFIATSLDGYIARKDGSVDWLFTDADYGFKRFFASIGSMLMGRKTYEKALELGDSPDKGKRWYVFTRRPGLKRDKVEFISDMVPFARGLHIKRGRDVWLVGGADVFDTLLEAGLVDEMMIYVHPIILGDGIPLFRKTDTVKLKLLGSTRYKSGLLRMHYKVGE